MRLAVRARTSRGSAAAFDRALTVERTVVISWLCRGTLHLVHRDDYPWLHALTAPSQRTPLMRRLAELGVSPAAAQRGVAVIERSLAHDGPLAREALRARLERARVPTEGQAMIHLLGLAAQRGIVVRGPMAGRHHAYALVRDWIGEAPPVDRGRALAELARRYLAGHGPAGDRDLAKWAGLPLRDARAGLGAIAPELRERDDGLLELAGRSRPPSLPRAQLLGAFDPLLLGWHSRELVVGEHAAAIIAGGLFRPFALVAGRAAATWRLRDGAVELEPFTPLHQADAAALAADARAVERYLAR